MTWVFDHSESTLAARLVLLSIANHADKEGLNAYPGQKLIAEEAHVSVRTVRRCVDELVEMGELAVRHHAGAHGRGGRTNYYEMVAYRRWLGREDNMSSPPIEGRTSCPRSADILTEVRTPVADEPSVEPSDEPRDPSQLIARVAAARRLLR